MSLRPLIARNQHKYLVFGYPRFVGPTSGHLSECLLVTMAYTALDWGEPWPLSADLAYCTCDDWSPDE